MQFATIRTFGQEERDPFKSFALPCILFLCQNQDRNQEMPFGGHFNLGRGGPHGSSFENKMLQW